MKIINKMFAIFCLVSYMQALTEACDKDYVVKNGDTCFNIANQHGITLEKLESLNPNNECGKGLKIGDHLCLP